MEYKLAASAAAALTIREWARKTLFQAGQPDAMVTARLAELLALRIILLNLHFALAEGKTVTGDFMLALIERADHDKWRKADDCLAAIRAFSRAVATLRNGGDPDSELVSLEQVNWRRERDSVSGASF